jgi:hypothetical protein
METFKRVRDLIRGYSRHLSFRQDARRSNSADLCIFRNRSLRRRVVTRSMLKFERSSANLSTFQSNRAIGKRCCHFVCVPQLNNNRHLYTESLVLMSYIPTDVKSYVRSRSRSCRAPRYAPATGNDIVHRLATIVSSSVQFKFSIYLERVLRLLQ